MTIAPERVAPPTSRRLFAAAGPGLGEHLAAFGPLPPAYDLADLVDRAGLTGRGGAGFPAARKLRAVARGGHGVVVANASEGEPASDKDRVLVLAAPHLVLDGLVLVARAARADRAYLTASRPDVAEHLLAALAVRADGLPIQVVGVADRFAAGEESAVVDAINGGPGVPADRRVRVFERGVGGRPTLVHNVETLAHVALVARFGPDWFRTVGTREEPGTFLATVGGAVAAPAVREVAYGAPLAGILADAGGPERHPQAVLVGGYHGGWVPGRQVASTRMTRTSLAVHGATVGAGVVAVLGRDRCGLVEGAGVASYLADQSVGQCGPCVNGLPRMAETLGRLARRERDPRLVDEVARLRRLVTGRGACGHPDATARFVASTMHVFAGEVVVHLGGGCSVEAAR